MTEPRSDPEGARTWLVVLNYQGGEHVAACLESVARQAEPPGGARLLVVDNASTDGSRERIERDFPGVELVAAERNLGYAGGNDLGIRRAMEAGAEYVALLNMDATVDPHWLVRLVEEADRHPDAALLGCRVYSADGREVEFDGASFDPVTTSGGYADREPGREDDSGVREAAYACGAGLLMRAAALAEVGLFDETFFAYHEDVELSLRCRLAGWRVLNVADARIYHARGGSRAGERFRSFMGTRNMVLTWLKLLDAKAWRRHGDQLLGHLLDPGSPERAEAALGALLEAPAALARGRELRRAARIRYSELALRPL